MLSSNLILPSFLLLASIVRGIPVTDKRGDLPREETDWYKHQLRPQPVIIASDRDSPSQELPQATDQAEDSVRYRSLPAEDIPNDWGARHAVSHSSDRGIIANDNPEPVGLAKVDDPVEGRTLELTSPAEYDAGNAKNIFRLGLAIAEKAMTKRMERANEAHEGGGSDIVIGSKKRGTSRDNANPARTAGEEDVPADSSFAPEASARGRIKRNHDNEGLEKRPFCATCLRG
ncbi:hypothetical protein I316_00782 [Kwoniella heveanensis BCC8398]|uniref:Uncharacterized protein n=1 Tax=Kwoniella heveanensis BCC8398 TaxID=1296120 RepID=A0A1B9H310_9TREE|nr:hypothetical protein I316_00782 [Kwoniella heveanensis BCC8398]